MSSLVSMLFRTFLNPLKFLMEILIYYTPLQSGPEFTPHVGDVLHLFTLAETPALAGISATALSRWCFDDGSSMTALK